MAEIDGRRRVVVDFAFEVYRTSMEEGLFQQYPYIKQLFSEMGEGETTPFPEWERGVEVMSRFKEKLILIGTSAANKIERTLRALYMTGVISDGDYVHLTRSENEENQLNNFGDIAADKAFDIVPEFGKGKKIAAKGTIRGAYC